MEIIKNILNRKEVYFFTYVFLFITNLYLFRKVQFLQTTNIEFIPSETNSEIYAEISGAVNFPGVYKLNKNSLVTDLINKGGGLSSTANSHFVMKEVNMAAEVSTGSKLYIPFSWESNFMPTKDITAYVYNNNSPKLDESVINDIDNISLINSISFEDLVSIDGIGEKYANRVISGRPYSDIEDFYARSEISKTLADRVLEYEK